MNDLQVRVPVKPIGNGYKGMAKLQKNFIRVPEFKKNLKSVPNSSHSTQLDPIKKKWLTMIFITMQEISQTPKFLYVTEKFNQRIKINKTFFSINLYVLCGTRKNLTNNVEKSASVGINKPNFSSCMYVPLSLKRFKEIYSRGFQIS